MFAFTKDCITGIEQIDKEHEHLFALLNEADDLLKNEYILDKYSRIHELLVELMSYAETHFSHEENYMRSTGDPELEMQARQHTAFKEKIRCFSIANIDSDQDGVLDDIMKFMVKWLYNHILGSDMMIGRMQPVEAWKQEEDPCAFTEKYYTGIQMVDDEHRKLFEIVGAANKLVSHQFAVENMKDFAGLIKDLTEYTKVHFAHEELYMEKIGYAELDAQKRAHAGFIAKLEEVEWEGIDGNQQEILLELVDFLFHWLVYHIMNMDKKIPVVS